MVKCAIHQPHYFPWMGYLNKMAMVDKFIIMDEAQIEKGSNMYRNKLSTWDGQEKYITIAYDKKNCLESAYNSLKVDNTVNWQERQYNFLKNNYKKCKYYEEVWQKIEVVFEKSYTNLCEVTMDSINILMDLFEIPTEIILQSDLSYDRMLKKNELLVAMCKEINSDYYLSGNGARKYMDDNYFNLNGIAVEYQKFSYPCYEQIHEYVPNLSALDILFNCGIDEAKRIFWSTVEK